MALRWKDVGLVAGRIIVRQNCVGGNFRTLKSGKPREIPLGEEVKAALKKHRHLRGPLVFCELGGRMLEVSVTRHPMWRPSKRAGLRQITWHVLPPHVRQSPRHARRDDERVHGAARPRHASIVVTMRYAHLGRQVVRETVRL